MKQCIMEDKHGLQNILRYGQRYGLLLCTQCLCKMLESVKLFFTANNYMNSLNFEFRCAQPDQMTSDMYTISLHCEFCCAQQGNVML